MSSQLLVSDQPSFAPAVARSAGRSAAAVGTRDVRIDVLRGFFILHLVGNHFTWWADVLGYASAFRFYGIQPFGFSSAAEFFVFFSGYVLALVVGRNFDEVGLLRSTARCVQRAWQLYVLNTFTMVVIIACAGFLFAEAPALAKLSGLEQLKRDGVGRIGEYLVFRGNLSFFEILRNYIFFIPLVPLALAIMRWRPAALLAASAGLWALNAAGLTPALHYASFCPPAWQLVFFVGCYVGAKKPLSELSFAHRHVQIAAFVGLLALTFALKVVHHVHTGGADFPGTSKDEVGPLRFMHFGLLLWGALLLVPTGRVLARFKLADMIGAVGRNSLECFCLSNVLIYLGADALSRFGVSAVNYWTIQLLIVVLMVVSARAVEWFKSEPWRR